MAKVIQADRVAGFKHAYATGRINHLYKDAFTSGEWDETGDVQSFASHREASTAKLEADMAVLLKLGRRAVDAFDAAYDGGGIALWEQAEIASARLDHALTRIQGGSGEVAGE